MNTLYPENRSSRVEKLLRILGPNTLLLSWPLGKKGDRRKWKHLTIEKMSVASYIAQLEVGNIGVAQGEKSGGLCSIDIDIDEEVNLFLEMNQKLANSLRSKGIRGCNIWFRVRGDSPPTKMIKTSDGRPWGELRANGSQTIISGKHPTGCDYRIIFESPPVEITLADIAWPEHVIRPCEKLPSTFFESCNCTEETEGTEETEATDDPEATQEIVKREEGRVVSIDTAIALAMPTSKNTNHERLFTLARAVKTLEMKGGKQFTPDEKRDIFNQWYEMAKPYLRTEQTRGEYLIEFLNCYSTAKCPIGTSAEDAWKKSKQNPLPSEFLPHFDTPEMRFVIGFCVELQRNAGNAPFFLSCRTVQKFLNHTSHTTAANWLRALVADGFMEELEKGNQRTGKASRYRLKKWPREATANHISHSFSEP